ncbi:MAG: metalloregulator ArsR/SmtB family transcription factor [Eubacteriales bacterium]|nr:metalloregulator ArsR/SmtB family transcription factor [Eubacteriales bacterium]
MNSTTLHDHGHHEHDRHEHDHHEHLGIPLHNHGHHEHIDILKEELNKNENFENIAEVFKILSDPTRVKIFWLLCHSEECVANVASLIGMSSPAVSHHLRLLKTSGLIDSRRNGKEVLYKASEDSTAKLLHEMIERTQAISCPS